MRTHPSLLCWYGPDRNTSLTWRKEGLLGDIVRPKSFAGIFGGAPSVALATLALTTHAKGAEYTATEARSMVIGAAAL